MTLDIRFVFSLSLVRVLSQLDPEYSYKYNLDWK
jgi:hypothetical protein